MQPYLYIPPVLATVLFFALAVMVLLRDYRRTVYRLFAAFLFGMGLWGLIIFALRVSSDVEHARVWAQAISPLGMLTGAAFLHVSFLYTRARARKLVLVLIYSLCAVTLFLAASGGMVDHIEEDQFGWLPIYTMYNQVAGIISYAFLIAGIVNFVLAYRKSQSFEERNSYLYVLIGLAFSMAGGVVDYLSTTDLKIPPLGLIGNILFGILATVAILRYHLLDISIMVRKSVAYLLMSTVVAVPYVGVIILFNVYFQGNLPIWAHFTLLLGLAFILQAVWHRVQNLVDRWFYRERYDFLQELERFGQEAHDISNLGELGSSLAGLISRAFQTANVELLLMNEAGNLRAVASSGVFQSQVSFLRRSVLIQWFTRNKGILQRQQLELDPQLLSLTAKEKADIETASVDLFIPLKTNTGELVGLLLMGPKRSEQPYSDEDLRRILTVTGRMAVELENARLYAQEMAVRKELQHQNEQKTEFLHHVAHELKTPLTAIISSSELITADAIANIPQEQRERLLNNINRSAWLMDKKVSELLDLARIQIGRLELKLLPLDIREVIDDLTSQLSSLFKNKEQSVETLAPDVLPLAKADRERVTEVVLNLLSNANKFSPAGGHISIVASDQDGMVMVEVKDSAPTINESDRARIFDPYFRGGSAEDQQRVSGLGLGLAISKSLVAMQQGEIGVTSEEGRGNTFYFTLPVWQDNDA